MKCTLLFDEQKHQQNGIMVTAQVHRLMLFDSFFHFSFSVFRVNKIVYEKTVHAAKLKSATFSANGSSKTREIIEPVRIGTVILQTSTLCAAMIKMCRAQPCRASQQNNNYIAYHYHRAGSSAVGCCHAIAIVLIRVVKSEAGIN